MSYEHTKQVVSVYNYPEHLNPFYGDEQHKRIRFWKINGSKKDQNGSRPGSRRGSFNLGSLKDLLWVFKAIKESFFKQWKRLKRKWKCVMISDKKLVNNCWFYKIDD